MTLAPPRSRLRRRTRRTGWCGRRARGDAVRVELLRGRELLLRFGGLPEAPQHEREIEVRVGVVGVHGDDLLVERDRLGRAAARARANDREIEERLLVVRLHVERESVIGL